MKNKDSNIEYNKRIEKIFSNTSYMELLLKMTSDTNYISYKEMYDPYPNSIFESDLYVMRDLIAFYIGIDRYAKKNNLRLNSEMISEYYIIKYETIYFRIGVYKFLGDITYFCERRKYIDYDENFIDITDVINDYVNIIELNKLSDVIVTLYNKGFSSEKIESKVIETLKKLQKNREEEKEYIVPKKMTLSKPVNNK